MSTVVYPLTVWRSALHAAGQAAALDAFGIEIDDIRLEASGDGQNFYPSVNSSDLDRAGDSLNMFPAIATGVVAAAMRGRFEGEIPDAECDREIQAALEARPEVQALFGYTLSVPDDVVRTFVPGCRTWAGRLLKTPSVGEAVRLIAAKLVVARVVTQAELEVLIFATKCLHQDALIEIVATPPAMKAAAMTL